MSSKIPLQVISIWVVIFFGVSNASCGDLFGKKRPKKQGSSDSSSRTPSPSPGPGPGPGQPPPDKGADPAPIYGFLKADQLQIPNLGYTLPVGDLVYGINDRDEFFNDVPRGLYTETCFSKAMRATKMHATKDLAEAEFNFSNDACFNAEAYSWDLHFANVRYRYVYKLSCPGADLSSLDGVDYGTLDTANLYIDQICKTAEQVFTLENSTFSATVLDPNGYYTMSITDGSMKADGSACKTEKKGELWHITGCMDFSRTQYSNTSSQYFKAPTFFLAEYVDLTFKPRAKFYESGSMKIHLSGWNGQMTYYGQTTKPIWKLSNGAMQQTGVFQ